MRVDERSGDRRLRCAYCHDGVDERAVVDHCPSCDVVLHADCRRALGRCPTVGCEASRPAAPPRPRPAPARPREAPAHEQPRWPWALGGALVAALLAWAVRAMEPDTTAWAWVLGVGVPYLAALGLVCGWWRRHGRVAPAGVHWLVKRLVFKAAVAGVVVGLFGLLPLPIAALLAPAALTATVLWLLTVLGDPFAADQDQP